MYYIEYRVKAHTSELRHRMSGCVAWMSTWPSILSSNSRYSLSVMNCMHVCMHGQHEDQNMHRFNSWHMTWVYKITGREHAIVKDIMRSWNCLHNTCVDKNNDRKHAFTRNIEENMFHGTHRRKHAFMGLLVSTKCGFNSSNKTCVRKKYTNINVGTW